VAFPVLTILAERFELSKLAKISAMAYTVPYGAVALTLTGLVVGGRMVAVEAMWRAAERCRHCPVFPGHRNCRSRGESTFGEEGEGRSCRRDDVVSIQTAGTQPRAMSSLRP
jgi:hypothetical protein